MEEIKYPIYTIQWKWIQDGIHDPKYPNSFMYKDMSAGRIRNSTSMNKMFKEEQNIEELNKWAQEWFNKYTENYNKTHCEDVSRTMQNIEDLQIEISPAKFETWNLTWFSHETFDVGQSDKEALQSFENYVRRYEHMQDDLFNAKERYGDSYIALMGAEDRWRWCGSDENGRSSLDIKAPCRCAGCKDAGMIRINH